jgi:hypothetical protein
MSQKKYDEDIPEGHRAQENRLFWPDDIRLRCSGFTIHARPKNGPPVWTKGGQVFTQAAAIESLRQLAEASGS